MSIAAISPWFWSDGILRLITASHQRRFAMELQRRQASTGEDGKVCVTASELVRFQKSLLPAWAESPSTRYCVIADVPEPALMQLPTALGIYKPSVRVHVTRDEGALSRLLIAQKRSEPSEGIVDAYILLETLFVLHGDLTIREFPAREISELKDIPKDEQREFTIDRGGSYLYWAAADVHLAIPQLISQVDPSYAADLEMAQVATDTGGVSIAWMREDRNLRQSDIPGLSERHVRRLEKGVSRLTLEAAEKLANAFGQDLAVFLEEFSDKATRAKAFLEPVADGDSREAEAQEAEHYGGNYGV